MLLEARGGALSIEGGRYGPSGELLVREIDSRVDDRYRFTGARWLGPIEADEGNPPLQRNQVISGVEVVGDGQRPVRIDLPDETVVQEPGQDPQRGAASQAPDRKRGGDPHTPCAPERRAGAGACQDERGVVESKLTLLGARDAPLREGRSRPGDERKTDDADGEPETPQGSEHSSSHDQGFCRYRLEPRR